MLKSMFKKAIFTRKSEMINLLFPLIFFILMGIEYFYNINYLHTFTRLQNTFLTNIVFLNITHNAFTLVLLTSTLPLYKWIDYHGGQEKFWRTQLVTLGSLILFFWLLLYYCYEYRFVFHVFVLINFFFAAHHALSQTFGLSLVYTKDLPRNALFYKAEKIERFLFSTFMFSVLLSGSLYLMVIYKLLDFSQIMFHNFISFSIGINIVLALLLIIHPFYFFKKNYLGKSFFNLRYLLWPFTLVSTTAIFATTSIHGIEYGLVTLKMIKNDSLRSPKVAFMLIFAVIVFAIVRIESLEIIRDGGYISPWLIFISSISVAFSFHHYYLDRRLFKMRHQINRETVGLLLFNNPDECRTSDAKS